MGFEGFPLIVGWELTLACNLRCKHCGSSAGLPRLNELTLEESLAICEQFPALLVQEVDFTGGEPLVRPDWLKISAHLEKLGIRTKIITNGLMLGQDIVARMKDVGINGVGVSIDGLEATHDQIRGHEGLFQRILAGIELVLDAGIPISVITTVTALNIDELPALIELLQSIGVNDWQVQPIFPLGRGKNCNELSLSDEKYMQFGNFVQKYGPLAAKSGFELSPGDSFGYFTELDTRKPPWKGCPSGLVLCGITSDGKIKGCLSMPDALIVGDIRKRDLWDIWFHPDSFAYNRNFCLDDLGSSCHSCAKGEECKGGCSAMSYGSTGSLHNDPYCFYRMRQRGGEIKAEGQ